MSGAAAHFYDVENTLRNKKDLVGSPSQSMPVGLASSPKGRAFGSPRKLHLFAKASPFGRGGCERSEQTERARMLIMTEKFVTQFSKKSLFLFTVSS